MENGARKNHKFKCGFGLTGKSKSLNLRDHLAVVDICILLSAMLLIYTKFIKYAVFILVICSFCVYLQFVPFN